MKNKLKKLREQLKDKTFFGESNCYSQEPQENENAYLKIEYYPGRLVVKNKSPIFRTEARLELQFDTSFNIISYKEFEGGRLRKKYSSNEIKEAKEGIEQIVLWKDPRYMLKVGKNFRKLPRTNIYRAKIILGKSGLPLKDVFIYVEIYLDNDGFLEKMKIRRFVGEKELIGQGEEIKFSN